MQSIQNQVLSRIYGKKRGWVFTPAHFLDLGSDLSVRKAMQILCDRGQIRRLAPGLYDYPRNHPKLGILSPTPEQIAQQKKQAALNQPPQSELKIEDLGTKDINGVSADGKRTTRSIPAGEEGRRSEY